MKGSIKTKLDGEAYARDGFCCAECGKEEGIEAHHIAPDVEELDNLITLCHSCHKKHHDMAGCFVSGFDARRGKGDPSNLSKGNYKGHPFWGNGYTKARND